MLVFPIEFSLFSSPRCWDASSRVLSSLLACADRKPKEIPAMQQGLRPSESLFSASRLLPLHMSSEIGKLNLSVSECRCSKYFNIHTSAPALREEFCDEDIDFRRGRLLWMAYRALPIRARASGRNCRQFCAETLGPRIRSNEFNAHCFSTRTPTRLAAPFGSHHRIFCWRHC